MNTLSTNSISAVKNSYGRCLINKDFFNKFYHSFVNSHADIQARFSQANEKEQMKMIQHGVNLVLMYIQGGPGSTGEFGLNRVKKGHGSIPTELYPYWKSTLIKTVSEFDRKFDSNLKHQWEQVLDIGIDYFTAR